MLKRISIIFIILLFILSPIGFCSNYEIVIEDDADLLTDEEEELLEEDMEKISEYGNIAFKSLSINNISTSSYAENYYHDKFGTESGTLFLIDMYNREIYIFSDGDNYKKINKAKANTITDNVYKYASNKDYYKCAKEAYSQMYSVLNGYKIAEPMKNVSNLLIAFMTSLFLNFLFFRKLTGVKKTSEDDLLKEFNMNLSYDVPDIIRTGTHKVYSPQSSSSGGGHGGGGGHSSGGGGRT